MTCEGIPGGCFKGDINITFIEKIKNWDDCQYSGQYSGKRSEKVNYKLKI